MQPITNRDRDAPRPRRRDLLDLVLLQSFVAVVDCAGFSAAARRLSLTQSAVSGHIRRLEDAIGAPLLARAPQGVALTAMGEQLLDHARRLLEQNDMAWESLRGQEVSGTLRLGVPDDYAPYLVEVLAEFATRHPAVDLELVGGMSVDLAERVRRNRLDLALVNRPIAAAGGGEVLRRESLAWVASRLYSPETLRPLPLAVSPRDSGCLFRQAALAALDEAGIPWRVIHASATMTGLALAVDAGLGVAIMTPRMVPASMRIVSPDDAGLPPLPQVDLVLYRGPGRPSAAVRAFGDLMAARLPTL